MSYSTLIVTHIWPFITAVLKTTFHKDVASWKECSNLVLKLNYLEMDMCVVSDMCHCSSLKHLKCPAVSLWFSGGSPGCLGVEFGNMAPVSPTSLSSSCGALTAPSVSGI